MAFTTLAHHVDLEWLREAHGRTRKDGAAGVDRQSAEEYAANLETNLQSLLDRVKSGTYRAPPVRRVHIAKGDGSQTRPIGIPTFEDKVLQRAVAMLLEAVYEQDFLPCSYGFRPNRSAHQALIEVQHQAVVMGGGWVLEIDVRKFFDTLDHSHLRAILEQRVRDGVLLRLIGKGLNAGVLEAGVVSYPDAGSPQGGAIYARVSSEQQAQQATVESQITTLKQRVAADGHLVLPHDVFVDEGFSGATLVRPALERLRDRAADGGIDFHRSWRTSTCTRCLSRGSRARCSLGFTAERTSYATRTMR